MDDFREGEDVFLLVKWRDLDGKVNPRGEVAAVLGVGVRVLEGGKTGLLEDRSGRWVLPLIDGFVFRDHLTSLIQAESYVEQYFDPSRPDPFAGQQIWG